MFKFLEIFGKREANRKDAGDDTVFHRKYKSFKRLLKANNRALEIIADLEHTIYQDKPFTFIYAVSQVEALIVEVASIARSLNALSSQKFPELEAVAQRISDQVLSELLRKRHFEETSFVLSIDRLSLENTSEVGGKAANLGEVSNRVHLPVPPGFAVTAYGYQLFLDYNDLGDLIQARLKNLDINNTDDLMAVSRGIQEQILQAPLPADLEASILQAAADLREHTASDLRLSVRSSATSEDAEASFAGQHSTVLNVSEANLIQAYKEVVASTFNPRAIYYRRRRGYRQRPVRRDRARAPSVAGPARGTDRGPGAPAHVATLRADVQRTRHLLAALPTRKHAFRQPEPLSTWVRMGFGTLAAHFAYSPSRPPYLQASHPLCGPCVSHA